MDWSALLSGTQAGASAVVNFLLTAVAVLLGVFFIWQGISKMLSHSRGERQGQATAGPVAFNLLLGALMVQLSNTVDVISETMFGEPPGDPNSAMQYMPTAAQQNPILQQILNVGVLWIWVIGFGAVIRGFVLWNALANGSSRQEPSLGWKGFWHIFFGAMAINITGFLSVLTGGG